MRLEFKDTIYEPVFEVANSTEGLKENDFWINIKFKLKNEDIDYEGVIPGMSFNELKYWNQKNKEFVDGTMKSIEKVSFIRRLGELIYYPDLKKVEKKLFLFDDVDKSYSVFLNMDEIKTIIKINDQFIDSIKP